MTERNKESLTDSKYKGKQRSAWWCESREGFVKEVRHARTGSGGDKPAPL